MTRIVVNGTSTQILPQGEDVQTAVNLNALNDVTLNGLVNGQFLVYNSSTGDFENKTITDLEGDISEIDGGAY